MKRTINLIAGYRAMLGMSQKEMASHLNISPQSYSNKERGYRYFNDEEKSLLKELFQKVDKNITIDDLFF